jgi:hypothetical protein
MNPKRCKTCNRTHDLDCYIDHGDECEDCREEMRIMLADLREEFGMPARRPVLRELENFGRTDAEAMDQLARNEAAAQRAEQERH